MSDPRLERVFENVRYVGKTFHDLHDRLVRHIYQKENSYRRNWVLSLQADGISPSIWPLAFCCDDNWQEIEREWITRLRKVSRLTNLSDGGDGNCGVKWSAEAKARQSIAKKLHPMSAEARLKVSAANSAANKGRKKGPLTEAHRKKLGLAKIGIGRAVVCVDSGKVFQTQKEAANSAGRSVSAFRWALENKTKCGGLTWNDAADKTRWSVQL